MGVCVSPAPRAVALGAGTPFPAVLHCSFSPQTSLNKLLEALGQAEPFFIRCIRSNAEKVSCVQPGSCPAGEPGQG